MIRPYSMANDNYHTMWNHRHLGSFANTRRKKKWVCAVFFLFFMCHILFSCQTEVCRVRAYLNSQIMKDHHYYYFYCQFSMPAKH